MSCAISNVVDTTASFIYLGYNMKLTMMLFYIYFIKKKRSSLWEREGHHREKRMQSVMAFFFFRKNKKTKNKKIPYFYKKKWGKKIAQEIGPSAATADVIITWVLPFSLCLYI